MGKIQEVHKMNPMIKLLDIKRHICICWSTTCIYKQFRSILIQLFHLTELQKKIKKNYQSFSFWCCLIFCKLMEPVTSHHFKLSKKSPKLFLTQKFWGTSMTFILAYYWETPVSQYTTIKILLLQLNIYESLKRPCPADCTTYMVSTKLKNLSK